MKRRIIALLLLTVSTFASPAIVLAQQGYFRVEQRDGVWWLIDPQGKPGLSIGVDHVAWEADKIKGTGPAPYRVAAEKIYPDRNAWGLMALARMRLWGFNTIGAWSDPELWEHKVAYTVILDIAAQAGADWQHGKAVDVYDPKFEQVAQEVAAKECAPRANDPWLLGYFSDNELRWGRDWRGKESMLEMYLKLPEGAAGRAQAIEFLRGRYEGEIAKLNSSWRVRVKDFASAAPATETDGFQSDVNAFLEQVATRYFEVCAKAIKGADPHHLYLGARFAGRVPDAAFRAAKSLDVVSGEHLRLRPPAAGAAGGGTQRPPGDDRRVCVSRRRFGAAQHSWGGAQGCESAHACEGLYRLRELADEPPGEPSATTGSSGPMSRRKAASTAKIPTTAW